MKLRTRFTIMFFSIIFISLFFLGMIIFKNSQRILMHNTFINLKTIAILIEARVTDVYDRYREQLHIAAHRLALYQAWDSYMMDKSLQNKEKIAEVLRKFVPVEASLEDMYIFDTQGELVAGSNSQWDGQNVAAQAFFKKGLESEFIRFLKKDATDKYAGQLFLATSIKPHEQVEGVVLIVLKKDILSEITRINLQIGQSEDILLAQHNANGDAEFIAQRRFQDQEKALPIIPKERTDVPITQALAGKEDVFDKAVDYRGQLVLAATRYVEPLDIGLVVKVDRSEFLRPVQELNKIVMIFGGIIMFFTLFMAFIIARSLSTPIENLSRDADKIASGDFAAGFLRQENQEQDEIGVLTRSLVGMSKKLIAANKSLESDVKARTHELEKRLAELELLNKITTGREMLMIEQKKRINQLSKELNLKEPYDLSFLDEYKK